MALTVGTDSYISVADADTYFAGRLNTEAWDGAVATTKEKALKQATREIDRQVFLGRKADSDQALEFPRCYVADPRGTGWTSQYTFNVTLGMYCDAAVPQVIKDATCEQALALLSMTTYDRERERAHAAGVIGGSIGDANEYSSAEIVRGKMRGTRLCPEARQLLLPYLAGAVSIS